MDSNKFNKLLSEKYFLLSDVAQKYNYNDELLNMITFIYLSFYMDFGKRCDYPLYDLFNRVRIIYERGTVADIALKNGFGKVPSGSAAVTVFVPNLRVFKDSSLKQNPQTIILGTHVEDYLATPVLKLEMLAHEIRHALMGYYNTNILLDENTYYMRSGLKEMFYSRDGDVEERFSTKVLGTILDEIMNTFITELLVNRIMSFKKYAIEDKNLKRYLDSLTTNQPDGKYRAIGYNSEVRLLYPLLLNEIFISLVNQHQFDGEIDLIKRFIEQYSSICNYEQLCELLETIYKNNIRYPYEVQNNNLEFVQKHISDINQAKAVVLDINKRLIKKR